MVLRTIVAATLIVATGIYARGATAPEHPLPRTALAALPQTIGGWQGHDEPAVADDAVSDLGVDDSLRRQYVGANAPPIGIYVGYYASQRQGSTIHSPQHCLPGTGWYPVFRDRAQVQTAIDPVPMNRLVIQKGAQRLAVFYWYQGRGRIVANDFGNRGWLIFDAARLRRTDGGLVRLLTPVDTTPDAAFGRLSAFTALLLPHLARHLP